MKRSAFFVIVAMILIEPAFNCFANNTVDPPYLTKYHESLRVYSNGKAISHISLQLGNPVAELRIPLLINNETTMLNTPVGYQVVLLGNDASRFIVIKSIDNKPLCEEIELYIEYGPLSNTKMSWSTIETHKPLNNYSKQKMHNINIGEYAALITIPKDVNVDLSTINSNEQINVEYVESDELKEITISASNLSFNDIDQIIISESSSYVLSAYIIIIAVLITIHMVFLRFIFNN